MSDGSLLGTSPSARRVRKSSSRNWTGMISSRYAGASGDFNPIHYDEPYARDAGNESVFALGMLTAGFASHMISDWFGLDRIDRFMIRFQERVYPDDTITVTGEITDVDDVDAGAVITADLEARTDEGTVVLSAETVATLPSA